MADKITEDELKVEKTEGFKVGEKKSLSHYMQLGTSFVCYRLHYFLMFELLLCLSHSLLAFQAQQPMFV